MKSKQKSALFVWASKLDVFPKLRKPPCEVHTHCLYQGEYGGTMDIPDSALPAFHDKYAADLDSEKYDHMISENRTPIAPLFFDFDYFGKDPVSPKTMKAHARCIQKGLKRFFPDGFVKDTLSCILLRRDTEEQPVKSTIPPVDGLEAPPVEVFAKDGCHLIFTNLFCDRQRAHYAYSTALACLEKEFPGEAAKPWFKVLDAITYTGAGLRMLGSINRKKCFWCLGKYPARASCRTCMTEGVLYGNAYKFFTAFDDDGEKDRDQITKCAENHTRAVRATTIRTPDASLVEEWQIYPGAPSFVPPTSRGNPHSFAEDRAAGREFSNKTQIDTNNPMYDMLQTWLSNGEMGEIYNQLVIKTIMILHGKFYLIQVKGIGSNFCANLEGDHKHNSIYFFVSSPGKIQQRCYCRCPTERKFGMCVDYKGPQKPLPDDLRQLMFPSANRRSRPGMFSTGGNPRTWKQKTQDSLYDNICDMATVIWPLETPEQASTAKVTTRADGSKRRKVVRKQPQRRRCFAEL